MAPRLSGFTRASALGPITEFMERQGGSVLRVLNDVDLPVALLEQREMVVPLREQFRFLERAAKETGDRYFGARLGQVVKSPDLSAFGAWVCSAGTLRQAIERAHAGIAAMLQTSTNLDLSEDGDCVRWSIEFVEPETDGRHHNELLGIGYMMDTVRVYAGAKWCPDVVMTALPVGEPRAELEGIVRTNVSHGHATTSIRFDATLLDMDRPTYGSLPEPSPHGEEPQVPRQDDEFATIRAVLELAAHEHYPRIERVAAKLGTTRRSLQRRLAAHGTTFHRLAEETLLRRAENLLRHDKESVTEIALSLGYHDPAHFTRAFRRWKGTTPTAYRAALAGPA
ncbi:MAG: AraC family transcriptional regulator [Xanthomonadaceae bacterium]|nr:AraC family transcriptional regulator [Xanthomonadaceae bacterium]